MLNMEPQVMLRSMRLTMKPLEMLKKDGLLWTTIGGDADEARFEVEYLVNENFAMTPN